MRHTTLRPEFVEYIPRQLDDGVLYVSIPYCTAVHKCACGCGNKVVAPISPADWQIVFDGETLSLFPSVGNWEFPCQAHYWIRYNRVIWAKPCTPQQIAWGRAREDRARQEYFARRSGHGDPSVERPADQDQPRPHPSNGVLTHREEQVAIRAPRPDHSDREG